MGLFGFGKKKDSKAKNPSEFYSKCIADFHKEALKHDVAKKGLIFIPELMPVGEKITLAFLNDDFLKTEYGYDPVQFYFAVMAFTLEAGMLFAVKWHKKYSDLDAYADIVAIVGPADDASALFMEHFSPDMAADDGHAFFESIFNRVILLLEPYWDMQDSRQYTFSAMMAAYQLGVSMMLEKLGY